MKVTRVTSHVLAYDMEETLGYSQQYFSQRTAHLVEVETDEGLRGWGECFGPGEVAIANKSIIDNVIAPLVLGADPLDRDVIWHRVYNRLRDHGQKGMPLQALSGVDIALWDIVGKSTQLPLHKLVGGKHRDTVPVYGYGMMLRPDDRFEELMARFRDEAKTIREAGFVAVKMKLGKGPKEDVRLAQAVREGLGPEGEFMADANHCYTTSDALYVGHALEELNAYWFEEPVAPENLDGYRELRTALRINIAGGEAEFSRWGWHNLLKSGGLDIAQPEVCGLGGISEYLRVLALCHAYHIPVVNHVWGSAIAVAVNLQLLAAIPPMPGGLSPWEPMLELDTTDNRLRDDLLLEPLDIHGQVKRNKGRAAVPEAPGLGVVPDPDFIEHYRLA
ncbi:MAG: mandelate racemase/muconate lactonizing enzyme family protein [Rhodobacteraceae bacterium]|nr:mandelate racemase/muconate lactonizing enzyme family protein [Paracoccaceae bacterium]